MQAEESDWEAAGRALLELQHQESISKVLSKPYGLFINENQRLSKVVSIWHHIGTDNGVVINLLTQGGNSYAHKVSDTRSCYAPRESEYTGFDCNIPGLVLIELDDNLDDFAGLGGLGVSKRVTKLSIAYGYRPAHIETGIPISEYKHATRSVPGRRKPVIFIEPSREYSNKGLIYYASADFGRIGRREIHFNRYGQTGSVVQLLAFNGIVSSKGHFQ